jgi:methylated-DNA-[protein]-cysteine S-methyltransferase
MRKENAIEQALRRAGKGAGERPGPAKRTERESADAALRLAHRALEEDLIDISYSTLDSPFGPLLAASTRSGLVRLAFPEEDDGEVLERIAKRISPRIIEAPAQLESARVELAEYFEGRRQSFQIPLDWSLIGPFARKVLSAAVAIPYGSVRTYTDVAGEAGSPRGSRAAGNALGSNPIPIVIPCHRVLRGSGGLGGYAGGLERKRQLLELEGALAPN